jgi:hypothetical protein
MLKVNFFPSENKRNCLKRTRKNKAQTERAIYFVIDKSLFLFLFFFIQSILTEHHIGYVNDKSKNNQTNKETNNI